jgi:hypothetical protein
MVWKAQYFGFNRWNAHREQFIYRLSGIPNSLVEIEIVKVPLPLCGSEAVGGLIIITKNPTNAPYSLLMCLLLLGWKPM